MEIEKTSKVIKSMFEDCDEDDEYSDMDKLESWENKLDFLFSSFSYNKNLSIDYALTKDFLKKFNQIYNLGIFTSFKPPIVQEYFCKQLNFLLIIDFILTFFKVDDKRFDIKKINTQFIFDFFIKLGDFYNFMNYLDVDEKVVNYLKYMIVLYSFQLDRDVIETRYQYFITLLDDFLQNDIMPNVFRDIHYKKFDTLTKKMDSYKDKFADYIKEYDDLILYSGAAYEYLDDFFTINADWNGMPNCVSNKTKVIEIPNPNPPPPMHNVYTDTFNNDGINNNNNNNNNNGFNYGSDDDDEDDDDDYDDYGFSIRQPVWTPLVKKSVPVLDKDDANYEEYRKLFVLRSYQKVKMEYDDVFNDIKGMCLTLQLKKYDAFEPHNNTIEIKKIKTILGCLLDYSKISDNDYNTLFGIACEYGHIEIVKALTGLKCGDIGANNFEKIQTSPNRDIFRYYSENKHKYKPIATLFEKYKDTNYYEPKIKFT